MQITVHDLTNAVDVDRITITLSPNQAGNLPLYELVKPGSGTNWSQTLQKIRTGTYTATAKAYNAASTEIFTSNPSASFTVTTGSTPNVDIFLFQNRTDPTVDAPFIDSVAFSTAPVINQPVVITVKGGGGSQSPLTLSGNGYGTYSNASGDAGDPNGATITWTPNQTGNREIELTIVDGSPQSNAATVLITVNIDFQRGSANFVVSFNHAPTAAIAYDSTTSVDGVKVAITATYSDPEFVAGGGLNKENINYSWNFAACDLAGLKLDAANSDLVSSTVRADGSKDHLFILEAVDGTKKYDCDVVLTLTDRATPASSRTQTLHIQAGEFDVDLPTP